MRSLGGLAAAMALAPAPATPAPQGKPPRLRPGDTVGLVEPAGFSDGEAQIDAVNFTIAGMGLVPKVAPHVGSRYGYLAGTDAQRAGDINAMFADPAVRAVFAVRGGWGCARLLPFLDWDTIRANPKLLVGFSDVTALHLAFAARAGFPTIHGPNAANSWAKISWESLWRLAFAGNLSVLSALVGTPWLPEFEGAILFLEDVGEAEYRIDRMLSQLALSGILGKVAGVVFGQCARCTAGVPGYTGFTVPQLLEQYLAPLGVPAFGGANVGHVANQLSLPVGLEAEIDAATGTIRILEPVVI
jgi:muramoyltetrapeptide carboxypeptidase